MFRSALVFQAKRAPPPSHKKTGAKRFGIKHTKEHDDLYTDDTVVISYTDKMEILFSTAVDCADDTKWLTFTLKLRFPNDFQVFEMSY